MGIGTSLGRLGSEIGTQAKGAGGAFVGMFKGGASKVAVKPGIMSQVGGGITDGAGAIVSRSAKTGLWFAGLPFVGIIEAARLGVRAVGGFFTKHPKTAWIGVGILGAAGIGSAMHKGAAIRTQQDFMAKQAAVQTYGLAPGEFAATVEPQLRGGSEPQTGHAERVAASKQATPTAETAAAL